jgi:hypothetical protein
MKKYFFFIALSLFALCTFGQDFSQFNKQELKSFQDFKQAESKALETANYLLNTPYNKNDINRLYAIQYVIKWMEGTPDYTFSIGSKAMTLTKGSNKLLSLYFAAMTKAVLENKGTKLTDNQIYNKAEAYLVDFCSNPKNNLKPSRAIKRILKNKN